MFKIIYASLAAITVLAPVAAMATPADPSGYDKFKIAYTEQRQFESKAFRTCLAKADKSDRSAKPPLQEENMLLQSNCMADESKRLFDNLNSSFSFDMIREDHEAGMTRKWATNPDYKPDTSAIEKLANDQQAWMDTLDQKCMANFDIKTDDPKIVMPYFQSCKLTETVRRTIWYQRSRGNGMWHLVAENRLIQLHP